MFFPQLSNHNQANQSPAAADLQQRAGKIQEIILTELSSGQIPLPVLSSLKVVLAQMKPETTIQLAERVNNIAVKINAAMFSCCVRAMETFGKIHTIECENEKGKQT